MIVLFAELLVGADPFMREAIAAARALQPAPRNRHERRKVEALRRKWVRL